MVEVFINRIFGNYWDEELVPTDSELDDNGDKTGHDYDLPNNWDGRLARRTGL